MRRWMLAACAALAAPVGAADEPVFTLGTVTVEVPAAGRTVPGSSVVDLDELRANDRETVGAALTLVPGAHLARIGGRNEEIAYLRGFDLRQVPVFVDGVPVYVPYDGYVDLARFNTFDLSRIEIGKGFSSMIYGPNTLGGAINLVSRRPTRALEGEVGGGLVFDDEGRRNSVRGYLNLGTNQGAWYAQLGLSSLNQRYFTLPQGFAPVAGEDGGVRDNSASRDHKLNLKLGLTPNATDEYTLNYIHQQGEKGTPPYAGSVAGVNVRYWRWPFWDKESLYLITRTRIGAHTLKLRAYHDTYENGLQSFDDNSYSTQDRPFAFTSFYDDYTNGASLQLDFDLGPGRVLKTAYHWKLDVHRENDLDEPVQRYKDRTQSLAVEGSQAVGSALNLVAGLSYEQREALQAQDYDATTGLLSDFERDDTRALNGQLGAFYQLAGTATLHATLARKSRFPTIKDRYSYRMGSALPNPALQTERALHFEIGYSDVLVDGWRWEANLFNAEIRNLIQSVSIADSACARPPCVQARNVGKVRSNGIELAVHGGAGAWQGGANYTFLNRENRSDPDVRLIETPRHKLFGHLSWGAIDGLRITGSAEINDSRYTTSNGRQEAAGFGVAHLKAGYKFSQGLLLEGGVRNLFDRLYAYAEGFPEPGRTLFVQGNLPF